MRVIKSLAPAGVACGLVLALALVCVVALTGRPVNDDYWAMASLLQRDFLGSLVWYYTEFQGNVLSWALILTHELTWLSGLQSWASALSIAGLSCVLLFAAWGSLAFLGATYPTRARAFTVNAATAVVMWLSLTSVVSPSSITFVYYVPSSIVHVLPWCLALGALGIISRNQATPWALVACLALGILAGGLGLVEGFVILGGTLLMVLVSKGARGHGLRASRLLAGWMLGLVGGLAVQVASPATWTRSSLASSGESISTNVLAVERLQAQVERIAGPGAIDQAVDLLGAEAWSRLLVPIAVAGDLLLRPGLIAAFMLASAVAFWKPGMWALPGRDLKVRIAALSGVVLIGLAAYSLAGASYAYAGRHVSGLAIVLTVIAIGLGVLVAPAWRGRQRLLIGFAVASLMLLIALAVQVVVAGIERATAWDAALSANRQAIKVGHVEALIDVPLKGGISQSGLRDHEGSPDYIAWLSQLP